MISSPGLCGHFALGTLLETWPEEFVFDTNVKKYIPPQQTTSKHVIFDTKNKNHIRTRYPPTLPGVERVRCNLSLPTSRLVNQSMNQRASSSSQAYRIEASRLQVVLYKGQDSPTTGVHRAPQPVTGCQAPWPRNFKNLFEINLNLWESMKINENLKKTMMLTAARKDMWQS